MTFLDHFWELLQLKDIKVELIRSETITSIEQENSLTLSELCHHKIAKNFISI